MKGPFHQPPVLVSELMTAKTLTSCLPWRATPWRKHLRIPRFCLAKCGIGSLDSHGFCCWKPRIFRIGPTKKLTNSLQRARAAANQALYCMREASESLRESPARQRLKLTAQGGLDTSFSCSVAPKKTLCFWWHQKKDPAIFLGGCPTLKKTKWSFPKRVPTLLFPGSLN